VVRDGAQVFAGQLIERRHVVARLDMLASRDPASQRPGIIGQYARRQGEAAADMRKVGAERAHRFSAPDSMALRAGLHEGLLSPPKPGFGRLWCRLTLR